MISKDLLKSINSLIPKKAFNPAITQLMYYKEFDTFFATDSYILLEIKNPFEPFTDDFCIDWLDLKTIKSDILAMSQDQDDMAVLMTKEKDYYFKVKKDLKQPDYKYIVDKFKQSAIDSFFNSDYYIKFFEIANNLKFDKIIINSEMMQSVGDDLLLMGKLQQKD